MEEEDIAVSVLLLFTAGLRALLDRPWAAHNALSSKQTGPLCFLAPKFSEIQYYPDLSLYYRVSQLMN